LAALPISWCFDKEYIMAHGGGNIKNIMKSLKESGLNGLDVYLLSPWSRVLPEKL
jgi:hypothetical protein